MSIKYLTTTVSMGADVITELTKEEMNETLERLTKEGHTDISIWKKQTEEELTKSETK